MEEGAIGGKSDGPREKHVGRPTFLAFRAAILAATVPEKVARSRGFSTVFGSNPCESRQLNTVGPWKQPRFSDNVVRLYSIVSDPMMS